MKKELDDDYEISVDNMILIDEPIGSFEVSNATFYNNKGKKIDIKVLVHSKEDKQIFKMKDGFFILEECNMCTCNYFYSNNINDLI